MTPGLFVVLEGVDGAGTTTHTRLLADALRARDLPVHTTREPSDGPIGVQIRQFLTGRLVVPGMHGVHGPSWQTMALLFAADRMDHNDATILPNVREGVIVLSDRYVHSSVAYQTTTGGGSPEVAAWVKEINRHARRPDLTLVLDVPAEVSAGRRARRSGKAELFEDGGLQARLTDFYRDLDRHFPGERIVHLDASGALEAVQARVLEAVLAALAAPR